MRCIRLAVVNGMAGQAIHRRRIRVHTAVAGDAIGVHIVTSEAGLVRTGQSRWFVDQCRVTARFRVSLSVAVARLAGVIRDASFTSFALRMRIRAPGAGLVFMTVRTQRRRFGLRCCRSGLGGLRGGRSGQKQTAEEERDPCRSRFHRNLHVVESEGRPDGRPSCLVNYRACTFSTAQSLPVPWHAAQASAGSVEPGNFAVLR